MKLGRTLFVGAGRSLVRTSSGMHSAANLKELSKGAGRYILATPIQRVTEVRNEVLSHPGRYADIAPYLRAKEVIIGDGERRRRYILCLNEDEADRQKWRRAEILKTLEATLKSLKKDHPKTACRLVASKRYGRYLSLDDKGRPYLDKDKVKRAAHLDGKFVLITNDDTLSVADIALGYKSMWIIESCFRKMKTTGLEVRPMFHYMPQRITAHVKLCVLALMIQRAAEHAAEMTWAQICDALESQKAVMRHGLVRLAGMMPWSDFDESFGKFFKPLGRPAKPTRLMVGLHYLKHVYNLSDEEVVERWVENAYHQYFCGFEFFQHAMPIDPSLMTRWRKRVGPEVLEEVLSATVAIALETGTAKASSLERVTVDTTVQPKAIAHPTDSRLYLISLSS